MSIGWDLAPGETGEGEPVMAVKTQSSTRALRIQLNKMTDNEVIRMARGAVDEMLARGILKCMPALLIVDALSDEKIHRRT